MLLDKSPLATSLTLISPVLSVSLKRTPSPIGGTEGRISPASSFDLIVPLPPIFAQKLSSISAVAFAAPPRVDSRFSAARLAASFSNGEAEEPDQT